MMIMDTVISKNVCVTVYLPFSDQYFVFHLLGFPCFPIKSSGNFFIWVHPGVAGRIGERVETYGRFR